LGPGWREQRLKQGIPLGILSAKIEEDVKDGKNGNETLVLDPVCLPFCECSSGSALSFVTPLSCCLRMAGNPQLQCIIRICWVHFDYRCIKSAGASLASEGGGLL
jgi:hypothetical protein